MESVQKPRLTIDDIGWFEISSYSHNGKDLVISEIKVFSVDGQFIKPANLEKVLPLLSQKPVRFKSSLEENPLVKELMKKFETNPILK